MGFDHPTLQAATNAPLARALWLLLQLHSQEVGGSMGSNIHEDMILTQLQGRLLSGTSAPVNEVRGSMTCQSSSMLSTSWQGLPGVSGWAFSAQCWRALE